MTRTRSNPWPWLFGAAVIVVGGAAVAMAVAQAKKPAALPPQPQVPPLLGAVLDPPKPGVGQGGPVPTQPAPSSLPGQLRDPLKAPPWAPPKAPDHPPPSGLQTDHNPTEADISQGYYDDGYDGKQIYTGVVSIPAERYFTLGVKEKADGLARRDVTARPATEVELSTAELTTKLDPSRIAASG